MTLCTILFRMIFRVFFTNCLGISLANTYCVTVKYLLSRVIVIVLSLWAYHCVVFYFISITRLDNAAYTVCLRFIIWGIYRV